MAVTAQQQSQGNTLIRTKKQRGFWKWFGKSQSLASTAPVAAARPATNAIEPQRSPKNAQSTSGGRSGSSSSAQSLWEQAYDTLRENNAELVAEYEKLLAEEIQEAGYSVDQPRPVKLKCVIDRGLERLDKKTTSFKIAGHDFNLTNRISSAVSLIIWARSFVAEAVTASPEASIAWAGVCLVLPLLTNPRTASEANSYGFKYVTTRMRYYSELERLLERLGQNDRIPAGLVKETNNDIITLYEHVIEFQVRSVLRIYRSQLANYARDVITRDNWKQMHATVIELENTARKDLCQINELASREALESLDTSSRENLRIMEQLHSIAGQQLGVAEEQRDISQQQLEQHMQASEIHSNIAEQQLQLQWEASHQKIDEMESRCHQLFGLTDGNRHLSYKWYKDRIDKRVEGTCEWFLNHKTYHTWLGQLTKLLLVTADPGCGKSVLSRHLVDQGLPKSATVCYFFFKQGDQCTTRQALCAILHQLFSQHEALLKHAMPAYRRLGKVLAESTSDMWDVFVDVTTELQAKNEVFVVLDAVDEWNDPDFRDFLQNLKALGGQARKNQANIKWLLTGRPYSNVFAEFKNLSQLIPCAHISTDECSETISKEVEIVIKYRIKQLDVPQRVKDPLTKRFLETPQRTYLWTHVALEYVRTNSEAVDLDFNSVMNNLPQTVSEAYENILSRSQNKAIVRKALSIMLATERPLSIIEMNIALRVTERSQTFDSLEPDEKEYIKTRLRSWCGLFVSIYQDKVYFLHETCREFLLADSDSPQNQQPGSLWKHSMSFQSAHNCLAEICVNYLDLLNTASQSQPQTDSHAISASSDALLDYALRYWALHYCKSDIGSHNRMIWDKALRICDPRSKAHSAWFQLLTGRIEASPFMRVARYGQAAVVDLFLRNHVNLEEKDTLNYRTPLLWAVRGGHADIVHMLSKAGADFKTKEFTSGETALSLAIQLGYVDVVAVLIHNGASVHGLNAQWMPIHEATARGHAAVVDFLIRHGASWLRRTVSGETPFFIAAWHGHDHIVSMFLKKRPDIRSRDDTGSTPFMAAARNGHIKVMKLLVEYEEINLEDRDDCGRTALAKAADEGEPNVVRWLLKRGAQVDTRDRDGFTPFQRAALRGYKVTMNLLLKAGAKDI